MLNLYALEGMIALMLMAPLRSVQPVMSLQKVPLHAHHVKLPTHVHTNTSLILNRSIAALSEVTIRMLMNKSLAKSAKQDITVPTMTLTTMPAQLDTGLYQRWSTVTNAPLATSAPIPTCQL